MSSRTRWIDLAEVVGVLLVVLIFGAAGGFLHAGFLSLIGLLVAVPVVWFLLARRGESLRDLGLRPPASWFYAVALALAVAVACLAAALLALDLTGLRPGLGWFDGLGGNLPGLLWALLVLAIGIAAEEVIFRGFVVTRLAGVLGGRRLAWQAGVFASALVYALFHAGRGGLVMLLAGVFGLLLGWIYLGTRRNLSAAMLTHFLVTLLAALFFYFRLDRHLL